MKQTRMLMGMPISVEIVDAVADGGIENVFDEVYAYFKYVDEKFSTYKTGSEISRINRGELLLADSSDDMKLIFELSEKTKLETHGYFDIKKPDGSYDPSGIVKGWAIYEAAKILDKKGIKNFFVDAGGDIETRGLNTDGVPWVVGIQDPTSKNADRVETEVRGIVKALAISNRGIATSGTYIRGQHIYNPKDAAAGIAPRPITDIVSLTVIGPNVYEADRFATAAFAMGREGIFFIESLRGQGLEGYMIDSEGIATMTTGFDEYVVK